MKYLLFISLIAVSTSCNEATNQNGSAKNDTAGADSNMMHIQIPVSSCYRYTKNRDTVFLKVERFPNVVTGTMIYALYEKDRNTGEIEGRMTGDTLVADYNFMSEGNRSTRQVVFLIQGDTATEGYGDLKAVDFSKGLKLSKVSCME